MSFKALGSGHTDTRNPSPALMERISRKVFETYFQGSLFPNAVQGPQSETYKGSETEPKAPCLECLFFSNLQKHVSPALSLSPQYKLILSVQSPPPPGSFL